MTKNNERTYVLVHGAWRGSWSWKRVRRQLQAAGHQVFTPTLTGLGERSHLASSDINLSTHIDDIVNLIRWEELSDVILCGHSYAGCVISGVADKVGERIKALVYLDAFLLENGESIMDLHSAELVEGARQQALATGDGWKLAPIPSAVFNDNLNDREWIDAQSTPQPIGTFEERIRLTGQLMSVGEIAYIAATGYSGPFALPFSYERAKAKNWRVSTIDCGHDVMLDRPDQLTQLLLEYAR